MPGLLRDLAVGRSWRSRLARGATVLALGGAWVAPTFGLCPPLALYNTTESVAPGLYLYAHDARSVAPTRGDYVAVRNPPHFDVPWLMKRVVGVEGDTFCWDPAIDTHRLNGRPMPPPSPEAEAMGLAVWEGCVTLGPGQIVGYGRTPDSYDSRYRPIGVVDVDRLWGTYRLVWGGP
jgi:type IV secretory pathway protease TraF